VKANMITLEFGEYYHIFNRGNNQENLFRELPNYTYFLKLYQHHVSPVAETYAYCLLKNHFHLLVRIRTPKEQGLYHEQSKDLTGFQNLSGLQVLTPHQQFSNLFNSYTKAINKQYQRTGNLFHRPFQRLRVDSDAYFLTLVRYIHFNPQKHGFVQNFQEYPYSSYRAMLSDQPTKLMRDVVLQMFSGQAEFVQAHLQPPDERLLQEVLIDIETCQVKE
jgi:putative transposase